MSTVLVTLALDGEPPVRLEMDSGEAVLLRSFEGQEADLGHRGFERIRIRRVSLSLQATPSMTLGDVGHARATLWVSASRI